MPETNSRSRLRHTLLRVLPRLAACLLLCGAAVKEQVPLSDQTRNFIHVEGRRLLDGGGHEFAVKGISLGNWLVPEGYMFHFTQARSPHEIDAVLRSLAGGAETDRFWKAFRDSYITEADIDFIAAAGFTTIRVPLHWALFAQDADPPVLDGPGYALLDRLLGWCRRAGLRVILDLHAAPGGQTGVNHDDGTGFPLAFYVPRDRRLTLAIWSSLAARYAQEPTILGYDVLNEPVSPYADEDFLNPRLAAYYRQIAGAIRDVDPNHVIILEGGQWASNFTVFSPPLIPNAAYSYHMFWASPSRASIARLLDFSAANNVPLLLGESGELTDAWNQQFRQLQERYDIGWSFWTYKNIESRSSVVSIAMPPGWDAIAAFGNTRPGLWPAVTPRMRQLAQASLAAYLRLMRFETTQINGCYLRSLGLTDPQAVALPCSTHPAHTLP
jgi:hypothetical protein